MEEKKKTLPNDEVKDEELDDVAGGIEARVFLPRQVYCDDCQVLVERAKDRCCPYCGKRL